MCLGMKYDRLVMRETTDFKPYPLKYIKGYTILGMGLGLHRGKLLTIAQIKIHSTVSG